MMLQTPWSLCSFPFTATNCPFDTTARMCSWMPQRSLLSPEQGGSGPRRSREGGGCVAGRSASGATTPAGGCAVNSVAQRPGEPVEKPAMGLGVRRSRTYCGAAISGEMATAP
jgi:hypothetical protein